MVQHVCDVKNHTACESNNWRTPIEVSTGSTPDISGLLYFKFWEPVYYYEPATGGEKLGKWCGRALNYGDTMCYWILTDDTKQLIVRGTICSAQNTTRPNLQIQSESIEQKGEQENNPQKQDDFVQTFPIDHSGEISYLHTEELLNELNQEKQDDNEKALNED